VSKEPWIALRNTPEPLLGSPKMVPQLLVFPRRPPGEHAVEVRPEGIKPRAVEPPIILKPFGHIFDLATLRGMLSATYDAANRHVRFDERGVETEAWWNS
jgi:hypothetical protein